MTPHDRLVERLASLEREARRARGVTWLYRLTIATLLGVVFIGLQYGPASAEGGTKLVEANSFVVRDGANRVRARLECTETGLVTLDLLDAAGEVRLSHSVGSKGRPEIMLYSSGGAEVASLHASDEVAQLNLLGGEAARIDLGFTPREAASTSAPFVALRERAGAPAIELSSRWGPQLKLRDPSGLDRVTLYYAGDGGEPIAGLDLLDADRELRCRLATMRDQKPQLQLRDGDQVRTVDVTR